MPKETFVSIKIFDIQGKEIETLAGGLYSQGSHNMEFNARNLASGVYYYKMEAGKFSTAKKMLLVR